METAIIAAQHAGLPLKFDVEFKPFRLDNTLPEGYAIDKVCSISSSIFLLSPRCRGIILLVMDCAQSAATPPFARQCFESWSCNENDLLILGYFDRAKCT